jgi:AraC-like DNA-binding protein
MTLDSKRWATRGVLRPSAIAPGTLTRYPPPKDLEDVVDLFWLIRMDLPPNESFVAETLPHPCVNLVVTPQGSLVFGPVKGRFTLRLEGTFRCVSVRLRPGAFHAVTGQPAWRSVGTAVDFSTALRLSSVDLEREVFHQAEDRERVEILSSFLRRALPAADDFARSTVDLVERMIEVITTDPDLTHVDDLATRMGLSRRALERTFRLAVGLTPKWVIRQYRLQAAADRAAQGGTVSWSRLAHDLGYADQAHFTRDFRAVLGVKPTEFLRQVEEGKRPQAASPDEPSPTKT